MQKGSEEKYCNCRNSQCKKLYCQCLTRQVECNVNCRCYDCHNRKDESSVRVEVKQTFLKEHKGCSCRKSGCAKKYCECYQEGILCSQNCKCTHCQNSEPQSNRKVIYQLKKTNPSSRQPILYPVVLSPSQSHLIKMFEDNKPDEWVDKSADRLFQIAKSSGDKIKVIEELLDILKDFDTRLALPNAKTELQNLIKQESSENIEE